MGGKRNHRLLRGALGFFALLLYLALTLAGSFHWHQSSVDHCGCSCPAGHGDEHHQPAGTSHHDHRFPALSADVTGGEPCRLCAWVAASRTGARPVTLAGEAPAPAGFVLVAGGPGPDSIARPAACTRGPPQAILAIAI